MNVVGRYVIIFLAVILILLFPLQYIAQSQVETIDNIVSAKATEFTDTARHQGYITREMYEGLINDLDNTGEVYDLHIESSHPVSGRELSDNILGDKTPELKTVNTSFTETVDGESSTNSNTISLFAAHTHTADCYNGTLHVCNGTDCVYAGKEVLVRISCPSTDTYGHCLQYSTNNGIGWTTALTLPTYSQLSFSDVTYGNGRFLAFTSSNGIYSSIDGITWTDITSLSNLGKTVTCATFLNGKFYAIASSSLNDSTYYLYTTTDGIKWSPPAMGPYNTKVRYMKVVNGLIIINSISPSYIYYISPGLDLVQSVYVANYSWSDYYDIGFYNGTYYVAGPTFWTSTDLYTWNKYNYSSSNFDGWYLTDVITENNKLYIMGGYHTYVNPEDPVRYMTLGPVKLTALNNKAFSAGYNKSVMTYDGTTFYFIDNAGKTYSTKDLNTWTTVNSSQTDKAFKIVCNADGGYGKVDLGPCLKIGKYYDTNGNEVQPICNTVVTSITATNPTQNISKGGSIVTSATATYLDGHTGTVSCTASGFNPNTTGNQTVTLTYSGKVGNAKTTGTRTCITNVTVGHAHTDDCYAGHRHNASCLPSGNINTPVYATFSSNYSSEYDTVTYNFYIYCSADNANIFNLYIVYHNWGRTSGAGTYPGYVLRETTYGDGGVGTKTIQYYYAGGYGDTVESINYHNTECGRISQELYSYFRSMLDTTKSYTMDGSYTYGQTVNFIWNRTINYLGDNATNQTFTAPYLGCVKNVSYGTYYSCGQTQDTTPICNTVVTSITATNPTQTINMGGSLVTTATATYLDEHTGTVSCTASGFNPNVAGNQTVTLTYSGKVGNAKTTGTRSCTITVTVLDNKPVSLAVDPSTYSIYNGGAEPTYTVTVTYMSGSKKVLTAGQYSKTGWSIGPGTKTVTFSYTENSVTVTKSITINVLPNLTRIIATPASQNVQRYTNPAFSVRAYYEDSTDKLVTGYTVSGINIKTLGTQTATISYTENGITKTTAVTVIVTKLTVTCPICGTVYELDENDIDQGCPVCSAKAVKVIVSPVSLTIHKGETLPITVTAVYQNGKTAAVTGWISNYNPNVIGFQEVKVTFQGAFAYINVNTVAAQRTCPICGTTYSLNEDGTDPGCPLCSKIVTGINVVQDQVSIEKHQPLPITVLATFRDGHIETVTDWTSNLSADVTGTFDVTVFYKSATDHVIVKVLDEGRVKCPICGLEYNYSDSPNGCPVCSKTIVWIEASLRNGGTQVLYKSELSLQVVLVYKDHHRMLTYTGYTVTGYRPDVLGVQTVTVYYGNLSTSLVIEVINGPVKVTCPNGHEYYLNDDGTDPGCPYCAQAASKDNAVFYFNTTYTEDILDALYAGGIFRLETGDYLTVTIIQRDVSLRSKIKKMFFGTNNGVSRKKYSFGGEVL